MGVMKPDLVMKSIIPVVMAGVLGIYGLIIAVIIANGGAQSARIVLFSSSPFFITAHHTAPSASARSVLAFPRPDLQHRASVRAPRPHCKP